MYLFTDVVVYIINSIIRPAISSGQEFETMSLTIYSLDHNLEEDFKKTLK